MTAPALRLLAYGAAFACTVAVVGARRVVPPAPAAIVRPVSFQSRVAGYLTLRQGIVDALPDDGSAAPGTPDARTALAAALQRARRHARPGDLLGPEVAARVGAAVRLDLADRPEAIRRAVLADVPPAGLVRVNDRYPEGAPLATVPPLLLQRLEPLPDELRYGFLGSALIVLDVDTGVIVDVVPRVIDGTI